MKFTLIHERDSNEDADLEIAEQLRGVAKELPGAEMDLTVHAVWTYLLFTSSSSTAVVETSKE